ncbi:hypothetical protein I302_100096 [Kwoniella bestiolae CBS 10118]|uniref:Uncharacterized protein n=1 Tax=Kwoniella bestiolae CBS 10118 TaxID=1296100 RepID=A0A1B9G447_9TREE|nr:hypothetical protein I302_03469 [Kwoniella bestiolae CBS 10118]OCF25796.1 hypothetical protein I302_03469 [Kwoniella bestiolae CBS 10118]
MTSSTKQSALSTVNSLFKRDFKSEHEAHRAYDALWEVNRSLFPDSKAATSTKSSIGEWDEKQLSDEFNSDLDAFVGGLESFEQSIHSSNSTKKMSTRGSESALKWAMGRVITKLEKQAIKRDRRDDKLKKRCVEMLEDILEDSWVQRCLSETNDGLEREYVAR